MKIMFKFLLLSMFSFYFLCKNASAMQSNNMGRFGLSYTIESGNLDLTKFKFSPDDRYLWVRGNALGTLPALFLIDYKKEGAFKDKIIVTVKNVSRGIFSKHGRAVFVFRKEESGDSASLIFLGESRLKEDMKRYDFDKAKDALFSENERYVFVQLDNDKARLIDLHTGNYKEIGGVNSAIFSPNNKFLFIQNDDSGSLRALEDSKCKEVLRLEGEDIRCVEFSPKVDWLFCKLSDSSTKLIKLKNFSGDKVAVVSHNDSFLVDNDVKVIAHNLGSFDQFNFSASGKKLLFCENCGDTKIIDLESSDKILEYQIMPDDNGDFLNEEFAFNSLNLKFSPKGRYLAKNVLFGDSMLCDLENNFRMIFHLQGAFFKFRADEKYCAGFVDNRRDVVLFDLLKKEVTLNLHNVRSCKFCPDNKHVALVFANDLFRLIDITKNGSLEDKTVFTCQGIKEISFSQDGNYLFLEEGKYSLRLVSLHASGSLHDKTVFYRPTFKRTCRFDADASNQSFIIRFCNQKKGITLFRPFNKVEIERVHSQKRALFNFTRSTNLREKKLQDVVVFCERDFELKRKCPKRKRDERQKDEYPKKRQKLEKRDEFS